MATVLLVDDDKFTRSVLEKLLAQEPELAGLPLDIVVASDGIEAVGTFRAHQPDFVVVDLLLPRQDGFAVCAALRAEPGGAETHIAVVSGVYRDPGIPRRLQDEYRAAFFAKPYQLRLLTQHMARALAAAGKATGQVRALAERAASQAGSIVLERGGELADRPLPAVLLDLLEAEATGRLSLRRGKIAKEVALVVGHPYSVSSNVRDETLGHFLLTRGVISDAQHQAAIRRASERVEKVGSALVALGSLTSEQLLVELTAQARFKLIRSLRWPDGTWAFQPQDGPPAGYHGNAIDMIDVVLKGLRRSASFEPLPRHLSDLRGATLRMRARGVRLLPAISSIFSSAFGVSFRDGVTIDALVAAGIDRAEVYTALDALAMCDALVIEPGASPAMAERSEVLSIDELSELGHGARDRRAPEPSEPNRFYELLFDDLDGSETSPRIDPEAVPSLLSVGDESGVIEVGRLDKAKTDLSADLASARRALVEEYLRIQGLSHYEILELPRDARVAEIIEAAAAHAERFALAVFAGFELGRDYAKLEVLQEAYRVARATLSDPTDRRSYDAHLDAAAAAGRAPSLEAELEVRQAERLIEAGEFAPAATHLGRAVAIAPTEASYLARLGWASYLAGGRSAAAADAARPHLNAALAVDPDCAAAHESKGLIAEALGDDDADAALHLERALELEPTRAASLDGLERLSRRRGELRPFERLIRRVLYRLGGRDPARELSLWLRLGRLYLRDLDDRASAKIALGSAARLAPDDPTIAALQADLDSGGHDRFHERADELRRRWLASPAELGPGLELYQLASDGGRHDQGFVIASLLVALGCEDPAAQACYHRFRPRFVVRAQRPLDDLWDELRHPDDSPAIGALFELVGPVIGRLAPLRLADLDVAETNRIGDGALPVGFVRLRAYLAGLLGVAVPPVYARRDLEHQILVAAVDPPVVLVGDEALAAPERSELAFRLGRAMTYLLPGRAAAGAHPARYLKQVTLAAFGAVHPEAQLDDPDGVIADLRGPLAELPRDQLGRLAGLIDRLTEDGRNLNLSRWSRALSHTADRLGLLVCGDLPAAHRFVRDSGAEGATHALMEFALSPSFLRLRTVLGLSIDV